MMNEPISLDSLFKQKIFRIPDYQRGYAWQLNQQKDFWEDLKNLSEERSHYTGVLTLKEVSTNDTKNTDNEYWLIEDHSYKVYQVVDGQQRLTTVVLFLQAFIDLVRSLEENEGKADENIFITDSLSIKNVIEKYLYRSKPRELDFRTYKFGYAVDNPSYDYLRHKIFNEDGAPSIQETFYTLNLREGNLFFSGRLKRLYSESGMSGLQKIYKKLTKKFIFNEYVIKDEIDVFVAYETMNNRGKRLSDLELLKNRLIYLTTLYPDNELEADERKKLRDSINDAWKEVYSQLGRNDKYPLNDDDFLKAHWIMHFPYSRKKGDDYIKFLLGEQFSPKRIHASVESESSLASPEEQLYVTGIDGTENDTGIGRENSVNEEEFIQFVDDGTGSGKTGKLYVRVIRQLEEHIDVSIFDSCSVGQLEDLKIRLSKNGDLSDFNAKTTNHTPGSAIGKLIDFHRKGGKGKRALERLPPNEIEKYVSSLKESAVHWFNSYYPDIAIGLSDDERDAIDRLNRVGMVYFRPLLMSVFKNEKSVENRIDLLNHIERFIFLVFRLTQSQSNYRSSVFYRASRELNQKELTLEGIKEKLENAMDYCFFEDGVFNSNFFYDYLYKKFNNGDKSGFYGWNGLRYFLFEYESKLRQENDRRDSMRWEDLQKTPKDEISIEHIFPQTPTRDWKRSFASVKKKDYPLHSGSLGNLLLLSRSINSSLQNDNFADKKGPKFNEAGKKTRNGYSDGSHSEYEVAKLDEWTPESIKERGLRLLAFMEERWNIKFEDEADKEELLLPRKKR